MKKRLTLLASAFLSLGLMVSVSAETLKMAYDADPVSLDPQEQLSGGTLQLSHMTFDPLVRWARDLSFEPRLAEKWEQVNDTTMRFTLRKGVKFHSGNEMTAKDVIFSFNRLKNSADFKGLFSAFKEAVAVDAYTVDLVTEKPFPLVLHSATYIFPMDSAFYTGTDDKGKPKDEIVKAGESFASRNISGTGPYKVSSREQGVKVELPDANSAPMDTKDQEPFIVSIKADGSYWIDVKGSNKTETLAVIKDRVSKVLRQKPATPILVWGDSAVDYGAVVNLMSELQLAGAPSVGLVTEPPSN